MIRTLLVAACTLLCVVSSAEARPKKHHRAKPGNEQCFIFCPGTNLQKMQITPRRARRANWAKPRAWCGWWMRKHLGVANPAGNRARWWAGFGSPAHGPAVGTIVVWRHHVGKITGRASDGRWIVLSGNDGNAVRERPRSLRGAIAYRWPTGAVASRGQAL